MLKSKHCGICENQIIDRNTGIRCRLTNEKPKFINKCETIYFDEKYKTKILDTNIEFERIRRRKTQIYSKTIGLLSLGIILILVGLFIGLFALESGLISKVPLIIIGVGFLTLPNALKSFVLFRQKFSVAKNKKTELDSLLSIYNVEYDLKLNFTKDRHGNVDIKTNLTFKRKHYR